MFSRGFEDEGDLNVEACFFFSFLFFSFLFRFFLLFSPLFGFLGFLVFFFVLYDITKALKEVGTGTGYSCDGVNV